MTTLAGKSKEEKEAETLGRFESKNFGDAEFEDESEQEDKQSQDQVNVGFDLETRRRVNWVKELFDIKSDAQAIKILAEAGENPIKQCFSAKTARRLADRARVRLSDSKKKKA